MADLKIKVTAETDKAAKAIISFVASVERETDSATGAFTQLDAAIQKVGKDAAKSLPASIGPLKQAKLSADQLKNSLLLVGGAEISAAKGANILTVATQRSAAAMAGAQANTNRASFAVLNLGRIAQDSAFGFIGIANNIEPFIQSLTALRRESGSAKGALGAFFSSLAGPAGIGLVIGAISLFDAWSKGYGVFAGKNKEANEEQERSSEILKKLNVEYADQTELLKAVTSAQIENSKAGINQIGIYNALSESVSKYITNLGKQELVKDILPQYNKIVSVALEAQKQLERIDLGLELLDPEDEKKERELLTRRIKNSEKQIVNAQKLFNQIGGGASGLAKVLGIDNEAVKIAKETTDVTKELTQAQKENAAFLAKQIQTGQANLSVIKATNAENEKALANQKARNAAQALSQFGAGLAPESFATFDPSKLVDNAKTQTIEKNANANATAIEGMADRINKAIESLAVDGLVAFGTAIGTALSGGDITSGIKAFGAIVGNAVSTLGKELIALGTTITVVKNAAKLLQGPGLIIGGVALVAIGAALNNLLANSGPKLARGGITTGPTRALIGEGGPEAVIPLSQLARLVGGGGVSDVNVNGRLSGNLIYLSNQRGGASFSRLFG